MGVLGFAEADKTSVWKVLGGILHLGNVTFKETPESKQFKVQITNMEGNSLHSNFP
jgi:myosin heavy subunit